MGTHKIYSGIQGIRDNIWGSLYGDCHELLALLKEQMIIAVPKTLNNAGHIDRRKIDPFFEFCRKKSSEIGYFLLIVSWRSFPLKFPVKTADFSTNLPLKILRNLTLAKKSSLDCSQSSIFSVRLFTVPYFFVRYTASYRHWYLDFVRYTATYRHRYLDFQMPVTQSARFRWSYGRIEDCEQSNFDFFAAKSADFSANLDFFSAKFPRNQPIFPRIFPWKSREILLFFREISEALNWKVYQN